MSRKKQNPDPGLVCEMVALDTMYEVWEGEGGVGNLVAHLTVRDPVETLLGLTRLAPMDEIERLKEDFESGREACAHLQFINYFCSATNLDDEINDRLELAEITGDIQQVVAQGHKNLVLHIDSTSMAQLLVLLLRSFDPIDLRLLRLLRRLTPASFETLRHRIPDDILLRFQDSDAVSTTTLRYSDFRVDEEDGRVYWRGQKLQINTKSHFRFFLILYEAQGKTVEYANLLGRLYANRPAANVVMRLRPDELREPLKQIRKAARQIGCPDPIGTDRGKGYRFAVAPPMRD